MLAIYAIKVHMQTRELTTIFVNGGKWVKSLKKKKTEHKFVDVQELLLLCLRNGFTLLKKVRQRANSLNNGI